MCWGLSCTIRDPSLAFCFCSCPPFLSFCLLQLLDDCTFTYFSIPFNVSIFATNLLFSFVLLTSTISYHPALFPLPVSWSFLVIIASLQIILCLLCQDLLILFPSLLHSLSSLPCLVSSHWGGDDCRSITHKGTHSQLLSIKS